MRKFSHALLLSLTLSISTLIAPAQTSSATPKDGVESDVAAFVGLWNGTFSQKTGVTNPPTFSYPIILEIQPRQDREIVVTMEWPDNRRGNSRTSGVGVVTPNCASWVEMKSEYGMGAALFGRYMAKISKDGALEGRYFTDAKKYFADAFEEVGTFTLKRADLSALQAFKRENRQAIDRLLSASKQIEFLDPAWRRIFPLASLWLKNRLGYDLKMVDEQVVPDREYAIRLAEALEKRENLFEQNPTAEIPLSLQSGTNLNIKAYLLSLPNGYGIAGKKFPLRIDLHGGGGAGPVHFKTFTAPRETTFVAIRPISEQAWKPSDLNIFLSEIKSLLVIDEERIYLTGASMGGMGTYFWAVANPEHFAAIGPICGQGDIFRASRLKNVPVWIFHGEKDDRIPIYCGETMLAALQDCGANVRHTFYPEGQHNLQSLIDYQALDNWFLEHRRPSLPIPPDPVDEWNPVDDGLSQKKIVTLPAQRFGSVQTKSNYASIIALRPKLYDLYRKAGHLPRGMVQEQRLPSLPEGMINLLLAIPQSIGGDSASDEITIVDLPVRRALSFAISWRDDASEKSVIESALKELAQKGETPSGEIRKMNLAFNYNNRRIDRIDIILAK